MSVRDVWGDGVVLGEVWIWKDVVGVGILGRLCVCGVPTIWSVRCVLQWWRYRVLTVEISEKA